MEAATATPVNFASSLRYNVYHRTNITGNEERFFPGWNNLTRVQKGIFYEYVNQKKIIASRSIALDVILGEKRDHEWRYKIPGGKYQTVPATEDDVDWAYAIGAGGGCEYEWEFE